MAQEKCPSKTEFVPLSRIGVVNHVPDTNVVQHQNDGFFAVQNGLIQLPFRLHNFDIVGIEAIPMLCPAPDAHPVQRHGLVTRVEIHRQGCIFFNAGHREDLPDGVKESLVLQGVDLPFQQQPMLIGTGIEEAGRRWLIEKLGLHPTAGRRKPYVGKIGSISLNRHRQNAHAANPPQASER